MAPSVTAPLRIALTADPDLPMPPVLCGGIERVIDMVACGLQQRGNLVTLFAHPQSTTPVTRVGWREAASQPRSDTQRNRLTLARTVLGGGFDLMHSSSRPSDLTPLLPLPIPTLMCYQRPVSPRTMSLAWKLPRGALEFCAISRRITKDVEQIGPPNRHRLRRFVGWRSARLIQLLVVGGRPRSTGGVAS